jgi:hypothetical protein
MDVIIKKEDVEYLKTLNLKRSEQQYYAQNEKYVISPDNLKQDNKIYIFPNCKIKKLPLRKYLKDKNVKQVFNPKEADVLVMKESTLNFGEWGTSTITFTNKFEIPVGTYYHNCNPSNLYKDILGPQYYNYHQYQRFVYTVHLKENKDFQYNQYYLSKYDSEYKKYQKIYKCKAVGKIYHSKINKDHIDALIDKSKNFINEIDLQQVVYDWEVEKKIRVDSSDYNWKAIQDLLESNDSWELAIEMIKKLDVESILSKLITCYYGRRIQEPCLRAIYQKIFSRNPLLLQCIHRWCSYSVYSRYNDNGIKTMLDECKRNNITINLEDFRLSDINVESFVAQNGDTLYNITDIDIA